MRYALSGAWFAALSAGSAVDVSHCRSKQLAQPASQAVPPAKLATLQAQMGQTVQKDNESSGSSPRSEGACHCSSHTSYYKVLCYRLSSACRPHVHRLGQRRCDRPAHESNADVDWQHVVVRREWSGVGDHGHHGHNGQAAAWA